MGFRFIKENAKDFDDVISSLKKKKLEEEAKIWSNITHGDQHEKKFLGRFDLVKSKSTEELDPKELAEKLDKNIRDKKKSLAATQGNINIDRLMDLLK